MPDYVEVDHNKMTAKLTRVPARPRCPTRSDGTAPRRRILFALIVEAQPKDQKAAHRAAFFVLRHQPPSCSAFDALLNCLGGIADVCSWSRVAGAASVLPAL